MRKFTRLYASAYQIIGPLCLKHYDFKRSIVEFLLKAYVGLDRVPTSWTSSVRSEFDQSRGCAVNAVESVFRPARLGSIPDDREAGVRVRSAAPSCRAGVCDAEAIRGFQVKPVQQLPQRGYGALQARRPVQNRVGLKRRRGQSRTGTQSEHSRRSRRLSPGPARKENHYGWMAWMRSGARPTKSGATEVPKPFRQSLPCLPGHHPSLDFRGTIGSAFRKSFQLHICVQPAP